MFAQMDRIQPIMSPGLILIAIILSVGTVFSAISIGIELADGFEFTARASGAAYPICLGAQALISVLLILLSRREDQTPSTPIPWQRLARPAMALNVTIAALAAYVTLNAGVGLIGVITGLALGEGFRLKAMIGATMAAAPTFDDVS